MCVYSRKQQFLSPQRLEHHSCEQPTHLGGVGIRPDGGTARAGYRGIPVGEQVKNGHGGDREPDGAVYSEVRAF